MPGFDAVIVYSVGRGRKFQKIGDRRQETGDRR
jgi:hypothetical protein